MFNRVATAALMACLVAPAELSAQHQATAQTSAASEDFQDLPVPEWARGILTSFDQPVHPLIGGVASGGGLGAGIGYKSPDAGPWYREASAMATVRRYWSVEGELGRRASDNRYLAAAFGGIRHMNRIDYFGLGPDTLRDDRSTFRLRETTFGARVSMQPTSLVRLGGSAAVYLPDLGRGAHPTFPSIEERFAEDTVPGFSAEPVFGRYRGLVELRSSLEDEDRYRGVYQFVVEHVRDHDSGRHNFNRWEAETQHVVPGLRRDHRLTLHGLLASTDDDADVPFYLMYTLGGSGGLKSFRPDLLGTDGTRATLRGFRNYRFRDRDLVLMQAEYRVPVHERVHATVFVDAGQVAPRMSDLFTNVRTTTGFSVSYMRHGRSLGRIDVGFGGDGVQWFWSFGAFSPD